LSPSELQEFIELKVSPNNTSQTVEKIRSLKDNITIFFYIFYINQ
jgi:hypothetical protein